MQGKGYPRASLALRIPLGPNRGAEANCKGLVTSRRERPFRRLIPHRRGSACRVTPGTPIAAVFRELSPGGFLRRCHPCKWAPRAALSRMPALGARGGWGGLGGHCQASFALPSFPPRRHPTPPRWENRRRGCSPPSPGRRGEGVPARALEWRGWGGRVPAGLARKKTPQIEGPCFPWVSGCSVDASLEGHILVWRCGVMVSVASYSNLSVSWVGLLCTRTASSILQTVLRTDGGVSKIVLLC